VGEFLAGWPISFPDSFFVMNGAVYTKSIGPRELQMTFRKQAEQLAVHNTI
jgi:hypothetical protein